MDRDEGLVVEILFGEEGFKSAWRVREEVFVKEQGIDPSIERDRFDDISEHLLLKRDREVIGTGRLYKHKGIWYIGRMAVLSNLRDQGLGQMILEGLLRRAQEKGAESVTLHSQLSVMEFYEKRGFQPKGQEFKEAGIPHIEMVWIRPDLRRLYDETLISVAQAYNYFFSKYGSEYKWLLKEHPKLVKDFFMVKDKNPWQPSHPLILDFCNPTSASEVVDLGCGGALLSGKFQGWVGFYTGVDISDELIKRIKAQDWSDSKIHIKDLLCEPAHLTSLAHSCFDIVICLGLLEYFPLSYNRLVLEEILRLAKPDARIVLDTPNSEHPLIKHMLTIEKARGTPISIWSSEEFESILQEMDFKIREKNSEYPTTLYLLNKG